jgi:predicted nucleic acid-binding protein
VASTIPTAGLTDTDVLIDAQHGVGSAVVFLSTQQASGGIQVSVVSAMELIAGCPNAAALATVQRFLNGVTVLPITPAASQKAYQLMESFFLSHGLAIADALIAATALEHGLELYSRNVRHFGMIPGLVVTRPY